MSDLISIRKADSNDLPLVFSTCRESYSENFSHHWNEGGLEWYLEKVYAKDGITNELSGTDINYFIAFYDQNPVGFMKLNLKSNLPGQPPEQGMEIEKLYFRPHYQGKGIGKKLISIAFDLAKQLKKKTIWLGVIDSNESAIEFYKKSGFTFYDKIKLDLPYFKEELKGMWRMALDAQSL